MGATLKRDLEIRDFTSVARSRGVPEPIARHAEDATMRWAEANAVRSRARISAYYWSVVRRRAFRRGSGQRGLRARFVAASLAQDLREAGMSEAQIADEVQRSGYEWWVPESEEAVA